MFRKVFLKRLVTFESFLRRLHWRNHFWHWAVIYAHFSVDLGHALACETRSRPSKSSACQTILQIHGRFCFGTSRCALIKSFDLGHESGRKHPARMQLILGRKNTHVMLRPQDQNAKLIAALRNFCCTCEPLECSCCEYVGCCANFYKI